MQVGRVDPCVCVCVCVCQIFVLINVTYLYEPFTSSIVIINVRMLWRCSWSCFSSIFLVRCNAFKLDGAAVELKARVSRVFSHPTLSALCLSDFMNRCGASALLISPLPKNLSPDVVTTLNWVLRGRRRWSFIVVSAIFLFCASHQDPVKALNMFNSASEVWIPSIRGVKFFDCWCLLRRGGAWISSRIMHCTRPTLCFLKYLEISIATFLVDTTTFLRTRVFYWINPNNSRGMTPAVAKKKK